MKTIVFFRVDLVEIGGSQRLLFEGVNYFKNKGYNVSILTLKFDKVALFNGSYKFDIISVEDKCFLSKIPIARGLWNICKLRRKIKQINPDVIVPMQEQMGCIYVWLSTIFTHYKYVAHINENMMWQPQEEVKYSIFFRKVFRKLRDFLPERAEFIPLKSHTANLFKIIGREITAIALILSIKQARKIFVLSKQAAFEIKLLFNKESVVLQGALPVGIFNYMPRRNIKQILNIEDKKMILSINRLIQRKRVDLSIKAFKRISEEIGDLIFVIGGAGPEREKLEHLVKELQIEDKVKFMGYIPDQELWDYYSSCDIFIHPCWSDFVIAPFEALALGAKVVCTRGTEISSKVIESHTLLLTQPDISSLYESIKKALLYPKKRDLNVLKEYSWDVYFSKFEEEIKEYLK